MIQSFQGNYPQVANAAFIAPDADIIGEVTIERDASIWYQCVLRGDVDWIRIGAGTNIQDGTIVHVEAAQWPTRVGEEVTVGHRAVLHGCTIEDLCLIGRCRVLRVGHPFEPTFAGLHGLKQFLDHGEVVFGQVVIAVATFGRNETEGEEPHILSLL